MQLENCPCCNARNLSFKKVLWDELILEWNLSKEEVTFINIQQGFHCKNCANNLRTMALANAISKYFGYKGAFKENIESGMLSTLKILEINEAGNLTQFLQLCSAHSILRFPEIDMQNINLESESYDLLIHSDTLEHIPNFKLALKECYRILKNKGVMFFTVPILPDRLTKNRINKKKIYHGEEATKDESFVVHSEYGADVWKFVIESGFDNCTFYCLEYPAGIVLIAVK